MNLLIDGDILIYQVSSALEEPIHWGDDWWTLMVDLREAKQAIDMEVQKLKTRLDAETIVITLSCREHNWRKDVLSSYKGNRKDKRKPVVFVPLRKYVEDNYTTACLKHLEADDVMGILSGEKSIIVSDDKDMRTIPGKLYRPMSDSLEDITPEEADRNHLLQTLSGDRVDNYFGCPGVGPVKAQKILDEGTWDEVVAAYEKAGLNEETALTQARVARILRIDEWDAEKEEVRLWNPQ